MLWDGSTQKIRNLERQNVGLEENGGKAGNFRTKVSKSLALREMSEFGEKWDKIERKFRNLKPKHQA